MNNACPSCGVLYGVTSKDIGRKLKCKKCNAPLMVTDAGLVLNSGVPPTAPPAPAAEDFDVDPASRKRLMYYHSGISNLIEAIGGIPTLLFAGGVFFTIVFMALPLIGHAGTERDRAYVKSLEIERELEYKKKEPKKKPKDWTSEDWDNFNKDKARVDETFEPKLFEAKIDAQKTENRNIRTRWFEMYGLMFGFLLLSFGCIGYLRTEQQLVMKIVAAAVLTFMLWTMFTMFGGCQTSRVLTGG